MRRGYDEAYREIYEVYRSKYPSSEKLLFSNDPVFERTKLVGLISDAIDAAAVRLELTRRLRGDARLFLLINMHQIIALPLVHPDSQGISFDELLRRIAADLHTILEEAAEKSEGEEISSHLVLSVVARIWRKLQTCGEGIWDDDPSYRAPRPDPVET